MIAQGEAIAHGAAAIDYSMSKDKAQIVGENLKTLAIPSTHTLTRWDGRLVQTGQLLTWQLIAV